MHTDVLVASVFEAFAEVVEHLLGVRHRPCQQLDVEIIVVCWAHVGELQLAVAPLLQAGAPAALPYAAFEYAGLPVKPRPVPPAQRIVSLLSDSVIPPPNGDLSPVLRVSLSHLADTLKCSFSRL